MSSACDIIIISSCAQTLDVDEIFIYISSGGSAIKERMLTEQNK